MLITPETSEERIRLIDENTEGFIYMVFSAAVTGAQKDFDTQKTGILQTNRRHEPPQPAHDRFRHIQSPDILQTAAAHAAECIIGSRFVALLNKENGNADKAMARLKKDLEIEI